MNNYRHYPWFLFVFAIFLSCQETIDQNKPNIVIIFTDDQNMDEVGAYGGNVLTPNIDKLAEEGIKFTRAYVTSPVCTPSRYSLITGRYASHSSHLRNVYTPSEPVFIRWNSEIVPGAEKTIAHVLKENGYTTGMVGKWHLGPHEHNLKEIPENADWNDPKIKAILNYNYNLTREYAKRAGGFDNIESFYSNNMHVLNIPVELQQHNMEWITDGALSFIEENKNNNFFLYVAPTIPHTPSPVGSMLNDQYATPIGFLENSEVQPSPENVFERVNQAGIDSAKAPFTWLDDGVGEIINKLSTLDLLDNTIVIFCSDHGSRGKLTLYETATRVPFLMMWPDKIPAKTISDQLVSTLDLAPTIIEACGISHTQDFDYHGKSLMPVITRNEKIDRDYLMLEVAFAKGIVTENYKYIATRYPSDIQRQIEESGENEYSIEGNFIFRYQASNDFPAYFEQDQLYNIADDHLEQKNLAGDDQYQDQMKKLQTYLQDELSDNPFVFGEFTP